MRSPLGVIAGLPVRFYRRFISPYTPAVCKYYPTCSAYCLEALEKKGLVVGSVLTVWRLLRCNPWSLGGVDRVPERVTIDYFRVRKNNIDGR